MRGKMALLIALTVGAPAWAQAQIYLCVAPDGARELTDTNKRGNCRLLDIPGAITAPPKKPATASSAPRPAATAPAATPSPADFPRVDNAAQKARDSDRRQILQEELKSEQNKLADLKKQFNGGEPERQGNERNYAKYLERLEQMKSNISRVEQNIEALKRELGNTR